MEDILKGILEDLPPKVGDTVRHRISGATGKLIAMDSAEAARVHWTDGRMAHVNIRGLQRLVKGA